MRKRTVWDGWGVITEDNELWFVVIDTHDSIQPTYVAHVPSGRELAICMTAELEDRNSRWCLYDDEPISYHRYKRRAIAKAKKLILEGKAPFGVIAQDSTCWEHREGI